MDWPKFLDTYNISYSTSGPNTSRGSIVTHCVWCGASDKSQHLSISLEGKGFRCWRNRQHAGRNPAKLIQILLSCSWEQAIQLAGQQRSLPNDFMNKVRSSLTKQEEIKSLYNLRIPKEFKEFSNLPSCIPYLEYITKRGFTIDDANQYQLYYATQGLYKGRVIFTIHHDGKLVGWTGRTIYPSEELRYKSLTSKVDKAKENGEIPAPRPIGHFLLFSDLIAESDADTIILCEGPFDALKVNVLGKSLSAVATCFFTNTPSKQQINLLHELLPRFKNRYLMLDQGTFGKTVKTRSDLLSLNVTALHLPQEIKDPALITTVKMLSDILAYPK